MYQRRIPPPTRFQKNALLNVDRGHSMSQLLFYSEISKTDLQMEGPRMLLTEHGKRTTNPSVSNPAAHAGHLRQDALP